MGFMAMAGVAAAGIIVWMFKRKEPTKQSQYTKLSYDYNEYEDNDLCKDLVYAESSEQEDDNYSDHEEYAFCSDPVYAESSEKDEDSYSDVEDYAFARDPAWCQTTTSGFRQQVFVMYHATSPENVASILKTGFRISQGKNLMLGDGLYVSRDITKTYGYGSVCFKLLVYPGKTLRVTDQQDPKRTTWQKENSSAWVPANCGMVESGREETCVKSSTQIRVLGIAYGHELLQIAVKQRVKNLFGTLDNIDQQEKRVLDKMLDELGIMYSPITHQGRNICLDVYSIYDNMPQPKCKVSVPTNSYSQLWTRSWDNCIENKATGMVLCSDGDNLWMCWVEKEGSREQRWKLDVDGLMVHKTSNKLLIYQGLGIIDLIQFGQVDRSKSFRKRD